jgi:hypothetical protein
MHSSTGADSILARPEGEAQGREASQEGATLTSPQSRVETMPEGILIDGRLRVTFQRYPERDADGRRASCGALPGGFSPKGDLLVPLARGEAIWIGLGCNDQQEHLSVRIRFHMSHEPETPELFAEVGHHIAINGIPAEGGASLPIVREPLQVEHLACSGLRVALLGPTGNSRPTRRLREPIDVELRLTDYATFTQETGLPAPAPLDPSSAYAGYLLP